MIDGLQWGVLVAIFAGGLRHGFDLDHVAAIADITSSQSTRARSFLLGSAYALGHASVLVVLGSLAAIAGAHLPETLDEIFRRAVGVTLVILGLYVLWTLVRRRGEARLRSRWMLVLGGVGRTLRWVRRRPNQLEEIEHSHEHPVEGHHHHEPDRVLIGAGTRRPPARTGTHVHRHRHVVEPPADPFDDYGPVTACAIGMIHGVGAETPTQILFFSTAVGVAGTSAAFLVVVAFVSGLLVGNSVLTFACTVGLGERQRLPWLFLLLAGVAAALSVYVGVLYAAGRVDMLPAFLGG